jgi:hypothetical protein
LGALRGEGAAARFTEQTPLRKILAVVVRAWMAALAGLPVMLRRRRQVYALRRISVAELVRCLRTHRVGQGEVALKN